eukprot:7385025-Prymnesium_polylepis.2
MPRGLMRSPKVIAEQSSGSPGIDRRRSPLAGLRAASHQRSSRRRTTSVQRTPFIELSARRRIGARVTASVPPTSTSAQHDEWRPPQGSPDRSRPRANSPARASTSPTLEGLRTATDRVRRGGPHPRWSHRGQRRPRRTLVSRWRQHPGRPPTLWSVRSPEREAARCQAQPTYHRLPASSVAGARDI